MKRTLPLLLSCLTVAVCLFGAAPASAEGEPDLAMYHEFDFSQYVGSPQDAFGFRYSGNNGNLTFSEVCDKGYITFRSTGGDPYAAIMQPPICQAADSDKLDYILIKYRTTAANDKGESQAEFYAGRDDGVSWANPVDKSYVSLKWNPTGQWETVIVDASQVWGNVRGVRLGPDKMGAEFRFDPLCCEGEIDVSYIRFYATREGAEAAALAERAEEPDAEGVFHARKPAVPKKPFDPDNPSLKYLIDGSLLDCVDTTGTGNACEPAAYDYAKGYVTLKATGDDPYYSLAAQTEVGPFMAVKYRTEAQGRMGEMFIGKSATALGSEDHVSWALVADGTWQTAIVNLGALADYDGEGHIANHIRFDFLQNDVAAGESVDVEYIAFFGDEESARYYAQHNLHELPEPAKTYTATFVADGAEVARVTFAKGAEELPEIPRVPPKEGYVGEWETVIMMDEDFTIRAIYTPVAGTPTEAPTGTPTEAPTAAPTEAPTAAPAAAPTEGPAEAPTEGPAAAPKKGGCASAAGATAALLAAAAAVCLRRRERAR